MEASTGGKVRSTSTAVLTSNTGGTIPSTAEAWRTITPTCDRSLPETNLPGNKGQMDFRGSKGQQVLKPGGDRANSCENSNRAIVPRRVIVVGVNRLARRSEPPHMRPVGLLSVRPEALPLATRLTDNPSRTTRSSWPRPSYGFPAPRGVVLEVEALEAEASAAGGRGGRRSDVALKHNIVLLGRLDNGLGLYRFAYNGSNQVYVGCWRRKCKSHAGGSRARPGWLLESLLRQAWPAISDLPAVDRVRRPSPSTREIKGE